MEIKKYFLLLLFCQNINAKTFEGTIYFPDDTYFDSVYKIESLKFFLNIGEIKPKKTTNVPTLTNVKRDNKLAILIKITFEGYEAVTRFKDNTNHYLINGSKTRSIKILLPVAIFQYIDGTFKNDEKITLKTCYGDIWELQMDKSFALLPQKYEEFLKNQKEESSCSIQ